MKLLDTYTGETFTIQQVFADWNLYRTEEPYNHADTFSGELLEILLAAINGRNDLDIIGPTAKELNRYILKLRRSVIRQEVTT